MRQKVLLVGLAIVASNSVLAGQYDVSYSGGECSSTGDGRHAEWLYALTNGEWGGTALTGGYPPNEGSGPGSASCAGPVTATFTWDNEGDPTSFPPDAVFIKETSTASWSGDSGSCANGLLHPPTGGPNGQVSTGSRWTSIANPGNSFSLPSVNPLANVVRGDVGSFGPVTPGVAHVGYVAETFPVRLIISGTKLVNGKPTLLIGQRLSATLDIGNLPPHLGDSFTWVVTNGAPFSNYVASAAAGIYTAFASPNSPNMQCWFAQAIEPITVRCTFQSMTANSSVVVDRDDVVTVAPSFDLQRAIGTMQILGNAFQLYGATYNGLNAGVHYYGHVMTPAFWIEGGDMGNWNLTQILHATTTWVSNGTSYWDSSTNFVGPPSKHDGTSFPYSPQWPADVHVHADNDSPGIAGISTFTVLFDSADFSTYQLYMPPGAGSKFVPLKSLDWSYSAQVSRPTVNAAWGKVSGAIPTHTLRNAYRPHPIWTGSVGNGSWIPRN